MNYRIVSFIKKGYTYQGKIWTVPPDTQYRARVIILQNFNEPEALYGHLINDLTLRGYECFTFSSYNQTPKDDDEIRREMNRVLKLCCDDLDSQHNIPNHRVHLVACFTGGTRALWYGIDGYYRHRLKSIIVVNPVIENMILSRSLFSRVKGAVGLQSRLKTGLNVADITNDNQWQEKLSEVDYQTISNVKLDYLCKIRSKLTNNTVQGFNVQNLLIIHSDDRLCGSKVAEKLISSIDIESGSVLGYPQGRGNLFFENQDVYELLIRDLLKWMDNY